MAKKTINPIEQHIEKGILGLAGAALLGSVVYLLVLGVPYQNPQGWSGQPVRPTDLSSGLEELGKKVADRWRALGPPPASDASTNQVVTTGEDVFSLLKQNKDLGERIFPALPPPPPLVEEDRPTTVEKRPLVKVVAPARPWAATFRNPLFGPSAELTLKDVIEKGVGDATNPLGDPDGAHWAIVASVLDLRRQEEEFIAANYPPQRQDLTIYDVQLQRREVHRSAAGDAFGSWHEVNAWLPFQRPPLPQPKFAADGSVSIMDRGGLESLWNMLRPGQRWILRPDKPKAATKGTKVVDFVIPYLTLEPTGWFDPAKPAATPPNPTLAAEVKKWIAGAESARAANPPDLDRAYIYAEAAYWAAGIAQKDRDAAAKLLDDLDAAAGGAGRPTPKRELRRRLPMQTYDLDLEPGRYYQHRLRVRALNRFAGQPYELASPADARKVLVEGAWSEPSDVLEVPSDLYLFVVGADEGKREASIEVYKREGKVYESKKFSVGVGEVIGKKERKVDFSTGWVVLDIDFKHAYRAPGKANAAETTVAVVCADPRHPEKLHRLVLARDKEDSKRIELGGK